MLSLKATVGNHANHFSLGRYGCLDYCSFWNLSCSMHAWLRPLAGNLYIRLLDFSGSVLANDIHGHGDIDSYSIEAWPLPFAAFCPLLTCSASLGLHQLITLTVVVSPTHALTPNRSIALDFRWQFAYPVRSVLIFSGNASTDDSHGNGASDLLEA